MEIKTVDLYRAMLKQGMNDLERGDPQSSGRALVDFAQFAVADAITEGAAALGHLLDHADVAPWDEGWVLPEVAQATLDALAACQSAATAVLARMNRSSEEGATAELRSRLAEACERLSPTANYALETSERA